MHGVCTQSHTHTHARTHARTHAHTHTHTHTHAHADMCTHVILLVCIPGRYTYTSKKICRVYSCYTTSLGSKLGSIIDVSSDTLKYTCYVHVWSTFSSSTVRVSFSWYHAINLSHHPYNNIAWQFLLNIFPNLLQTTEIIFEYKVGVSICSTGWQLYTVLPRPQGMHVYS